MYRRTVYYVVLIRKKDNKILKSSADINKRKRAEVLIRYLRAIFIDKKDLCPEYFEGEAELRIYQRVLLSTNQPKIDNDHGN